MPNLLTSPPPTLSPEHQKNDDPLAVLGRLSRSRRSGEVVVAADGLEVHVYLKGGRVAWATSSKVPNALTRHLVDECSLDRELLKEIILECRTSKKRFGETLIEWGVATLEQVRGALRSQLAESLATLSNAVAPRALFLPREVDYSDDLTFSFDDVVESAAQSCGENDAAVVLCRNAVDKLSQCLREAYWIQAVDGERVAERWGADWGDRSTAFLSGLGRDLSEHGADSITMRATSGALIGAAMGDTPAWLFAALRPDGNMAMASTVVATAADCPGRADAGDSVVDTGWSISGGGLLSSTSPLEAAMDQAEELQSILVVRRAREAFEGVHRCGVKIGDEVERASRLAVVLQPGLSDYITPARQRDSTCAYEQLFVNIAAGTYWHYGTLLGAEAELQLWMCLDRRASRGLGWALLKSVARQLEDCLEG